MKHATYDDIEMILDICQQAHDSSPQYQSMAVDRQRAKEAVSHMITDPYSLVGVTKTGVVLAMAVPDWWYDRYLITNLFLYSSKNGFSLLKGFIQWAKRFPKDNQIIIGCSYGGDKGQRAEQVFSKMGLTYLGAQYRVA